MRANIGNTFVAKVKVIKYALIFREGVYMLLAGWEVRIGKNCDRGLENATRGRRPRAAFSSPRSQFFPIRTDPKPANNIFIFFSCSKLAYKWVCLRNFAIESAYAPSVNHSQNYLTSE